MDRYGRARIGADMGPIWANMGYICYICVFVFPGRVFLRSLTRRRQDSKTESSEHVLFEIFDPPEAIQQSGIQRLFPEIHPDTRQASGNTASIRKTMYYVYNIYIYIYKIYIYIYYVIYIYVYYPTHFLAKPII